jgi:class 3 adenylate cyclase
MSIYNVQDSDYVIAEVDGRKRRLLKREAFERFNPPLLGLGELTTGAAATDAIAAVFDLSGFTSFCKQIEPHLSVPVFLNLFLDWLMNQIRSEMVYKEYDAGVLLLGPLPFFVKFMGDGLLVLWDVSRPDENARRNIIVTGREICLRYTRDFCPLIANKVTEAPSILRCGLARGTIYSVGNGNDFVGSCINMAARIQKLPGTTFAFNRRGIKIDDHDADDFFKSRIAIKKMPIRGIGDNELVCILKSEFDAMNEEDRRHYRDA